MACIVANLGPGLDYNEATGQLEVDLSTDAGNAARIGTDGGLWAPAATGPGPIVWPKTVASLPAQAIGATGGSNLVGPSTSPRLIEYAIAQDLDIYTIGCYQLADGTVFEGVGEAASSITGYTDNPASIDYQYLSSGTVQALSYDAGTRVSPTSRASGAPAEFLTPDGGWGGFYAHPYKPRTVSELLRIVRGRIVVALHPQREDLTEAQIEAELRATAATVVAAGAQDWTMIYVPGALADGTQAPLADWVPIVTGAGITAGVSLMDEDQMPSPWAPAALVATGATWVAVRSRANPDRGVSDARISELVAAGLQVEVYTDARQYWTQHAFGLGARSVRSPDGVYARGGRGQAGDLDYRQTIIPGLATRGSVTGGVTPKVITGSAVFNTGFARTDATGRWFPPQYGWEGSTGRYANHQLLGTVCPMPDTANFELRLRMRHGPSSLLDSSRWAGIFWGAADDRDISQLRGGAVNTARSGYNCVVFEPVGQSPRMGIYRHDAGVSTALNTHTGGPGWAIEEWIELVVTVTGTQISFNASGAGTGAGISAVDGTYRGPYACYAWSDQGVAGGRNPFYHGYDNGDTSDGLVVYAALS